MQTQSRTPGRNTPGRRRNANKENVYFEPGKYGRKTGLTLKDTGVRDEHGFEPVSGIFSSPRQESPERQPLGRKTRNSVLAEASVLEPKRTPRLPPPRSQTPKRTNIGGSPIRHSAVKPGSPSRIVDDDVTPTRPRISGLSGDDEGSIVRSIERADDSARRTASMQGKKSRKSIFEFNISPEKQAHKFSSPAAGAIAEVSQILEDVDPLPEQNDSGLGDALEDGFIPQDDSLPQLADEPTTRTSLTAQSGHARVDEPNTKRKRGARRSDMSQPAADEPDDNAVHSSSKRRRTGGNESLVEPSPSDRRSSRRSNVSPPAETEDIHMEPIFDEPDLEMPADEGELEHSDDQQEEQFDSPSRAADTATARRGRKRGGRKPFTTTKRQTAKGKQPAARNAQPRGRNNRAAAENDDSGSGDESGILMGHIRLRSATPFDEPDAQITRSGRASIKPLAYWKNETFVYEHGQVQGVIRAEELPETKRRRKAPNRRKVRKMPRIDEEGDDEEEVPEDLLAEAWEEEVGVITGPVRAWDPEIEAGSVDEEDIQDVGFASRAIKTQEVAGGSFRYAKVLTSPFFGAGLVEIPPGGVKRTKNCRKMQMVFFVHEGKVTVDVAGMEFGVTTGGMWQVPRGNNYSIENESSTYPAKVFFAQGCEFDAAAALAAEAAEASQTA